MNNLNLEELDVELLNENNAKDINGGIIPEWTMLFIAQMDRDLAPWAETWVK